MIKPLGNNVIIKQHETENKTESGIVLSAKSVPKHNIADVLGVGDEVQDLAPGDTVIYSKYAGVDIEHEGEKLLIINANDILAKKGEDDEI